MTEQTIICTKCGEAIELNEALTKKISTDLKSELEKEFEARLEAERKGFDEELKGVEAKAAKKAVEKAERAARLEIDDLNEQLAEKSKSVEDLQNQELELRKEKRKLEDAKKAFELEMQRKIDEQRETLSEEIAKEIEEKHRFKDLEKEKKLSDLKQKLDEAVRKADQGSQQTQGEVGELMVEEQLRARFPVDAIEPIGKGVRGADIIQTVRNDKATECGSIIWESKRTKGWGNEWVSKLKDDQREAKADIAVIISEALPDEIDGIGQIEGVWVASFQFAIPLATALRETLISIAAGRTAETGKHHKMELLYDYLNSAGFKQRVETMVEAFGSMKKQICSERASMGRIWAKREKEIERYIGAVSGMYGDMEGIGGLSLPAVEQLRLTAGDAGEG